MKKYYKFTLSIVVSVPILEITNVYKFMGDKWNDRKIGDLFLDWYNINLNYRKSLRSIFYSKYEIEKSFERITEEEAEKLGIDEEIF